MGAGAVVTRDQSTSPGASAVAIDWSTEARYPDQAWEIEVPLRSSRFQSAADVAALVADFHKTHQEIFAVSDDASAVETIGWSAAVHCRLGTQEPGRMRAEADSAVGQDRQVYFKDTGWVRAKVASIDALEGETVVAGPAILESGFTSIVIDPGAKVRRDAAGTLVIDIAS